MVEKIYVVSRINDCRRDVCRQIDTPPTIVTENTFLRYILLGLYLQTRVKGSVGDALSVPLELGMELEGEDEALR